VEEYSPSAGNCIKENRTIFSSLTVVTRQTCIQEVSSLNLGHCNGCPGFIRFFQTNY
jgi:hypothetical protein